MSKTCVDRDTGTEVWEEGTCGDRDEGLEDLMDRNIERRGHGDTCLHGRYENRICRA